MTQIIEKTNAINATKIPRLIINIDASMKTSIVTNWINTIKKTAFSNNSLGPNSSSNLPFNFSS